VSATFNDVSALVTAVNGEPIESAPVAVTQAMIDEFARTTNDRQWIHVDAERARRESPYGTTIAHGFLTLSLVSTLLAGCVRFPAAQMLLNYGFERVRFIAPVPVGSEIVGRFRLTDLTDTKSGTLMEWQVEIVHCGSGRSVLIATWLLLLRA